MNCYLFPFCSLSFSADQQSVFSNRMTEIGRELWSNPSASAGCPKAVIVNARAELHTCISCPFLQGFTLKCLIFCRCVKINGAFWISSSCWASTTWCTAIQPDQFPEWVWYSRTATTQVTGKDQYLTSELFDLSVKETGMRRGENRDR